MIKCPKCGHGFELEEKEEKLTESTSEETKEAQTHDEGIAGT